jgi:glycosyltransferase involved in cell wall biosynthesis
MTKRLAILQVSTADRLGGAERVAWNLFESDRRAGDASWLAVGRKRTNDPDVLEIRHDATGGALSRFWWNVYHRVQPHYGRIAGSKTLARTAHRLASPRGAWHRWHGREDFHFPGTGRLLALTPRRPDVLHFHNLHGGYFDLRELATLSRRLPTVLTLHDTWLMTGHCAHSFDCDRWQRGCGSCPDLSIYPAVRRDATAANWQAKRAIFAECRLHVATPCDWLMRRVRRSMLSPAIVDTRVIPNGVDLSVFSPGDRHGERGRLGLSPTDRVVLVTALGRRVNPWKDYETMELALARLAHYGEIGGRLVVLALAEEGRVNGTGGAEIRWIKPNLEPDALARLIRAADVYVHASRADTFPNAVLEALACGTPVVATRTGGIVEQIRPYPVEGATGMLSPPYDPAALAKGIERLLRDDALRRAMGRAAAEDARRRFDLRDQASAYRRWYEEICGEQEAARNRPETAASISAGARDMVLT